MALGTGTHILDVLQQGYSYPQGKPQLAPGSLLHRLQVDIEPESLINHPPLAETPPSTIEQTYPIEQFNIFTPQYDQIANVPGHLSQLETHSQSTTSVMQPQDTVQFDYPDADDVNQIRPVLDTNYDVTATVPQYASTYSVHFFESAPAPPAATFDDATGYSYAVPSTPFWIKSSLLWFVFVLFCIHFPFLYMYEVDSFIVFPTFV